MSNSTCTRQHVLLIAASAVAGAALAVGTMTLTQRKKVAEKNIYESQRSLSEYLLFHYGSASELQQWSFGPRDCLSFPVDLATKAIEFCQARNLNMSRALDIGCAVGRTSFDLSRSFDEVIGIDFSHSFINAARRLAANESLSYDRFDEGDISTRLVAQAPAGARSDRVQFEQGDACALRSDLGSFDLVLGANLVCRLPDARPFLVRLGELVRPGGVLFLTTPFTWMEQFTPKEKWLGGYYDQDGKAVDSFTTLQSLLESNFELISTLEMPFFIREHARKNQWSVTKGSFWIRK